MKITFGIPTGYEVRRISDNYVSLNKDNLENYIIYNSINFVEDTTI